MNTRKTLAQNIGNERGFTLLEAVVAMALLTFGILTVCVMQGNALRASTVAYNRTEANNVALALVEAIQQVNFDDELLEYTGSGKKESELETGDGDKKLVTLLGVLDEAEARGFRSGDDGELARLVKPVFAIRDDGKVMDRSGIDFGLKWAVQDVQVSEKGATAADEITTDKIIRVFMEWNTPVGKNHLVYTTNKSASDARQR